MKKLLLSILFSGITVLSFAQTDYYTVLPNNGGTSGNGRAPQGARVASRSVWLITAAEMTASGFNTGAFINSLGFNLTAAQNIATTGTITIYLENTTDTVNNKSTTWATAITGMTTVSSSAVTIPATTGVFNIPFSGGSSFIYSGGALYVAFDYQNFSNPLATTANTALCNTALTGGLKGAIAAAGATVPPATVAASNFRPETILGKPVACAKPTGLAFSNPTLTSCDLSWTSTSTNFEIEYGAYGFTQGSGTTLPVTGTSTTVNSLSPSTVYEYFVRSNCESSIYSAWSGPYPFHTVFEPTTPTYNTSFEQEDFPFIGWLAVPDNTANSWFINIGGTGSVLVQDGVASAIAITPTAAAANEDLFSRGVDLQAGSNVEITYYDRNYVSTTPASTGTASYTLTVGTSQNAASQTTVLNTTTGLSATTFTLRTVSFTPPSAGTYYFRFNHNSPANATGTHALIIDNFTVTETLSNNSFNNYNFSVTPNPAKDIVTISNAENILFNNVEVTDINGRTVKSIKLSNVSEAQINISDLASGVYMMKIASDKGISTKKIIKE